MLGLNLSQPNLTPSVPPRPLLPRSVFGDPRMYDKRQQGKTLLKNMYEMFIERDCTLVEINPLAETPDGRGESREASGNFPVSVVVVSA